MDLDTLQKRYESRAMKEVKDMDLVYRDYYLILLNAVMFNSSDSPKARQALEYFRTLDNYYLSDVPMIREMVRKEMGGKDADDSKSTTSEVEVKTPSARGASKTGSKARERKRPAEDSPASASSSTPSSSKKRKR